MRFIALNGFRHSLRPYFDEHAVEIRDVFNWTRKNAMQLADQITQDRSPTTLIGFSDGATAAVTVAINSPYVSRVYAHSPMHMDITRPVRMFECMLYRTRGDKTPTYSGTGSLCAELIANMDQPCVVSLSTLKPLPPLPVRGLATLVMRWKQHQFHNCLPLLPQYILSGAYV